MPIHIVTLTIYTIQRADGTTMKDYRRKIDAKIVSVFNELLTLSKVSWSELFTYIYRMQEINIVNFEKKT